MKTHSEDFKINIGTGGRQIHSIITYDNIELTSELFSISYSYEGNILKSVMKKLEVECSINIPLNTEINWQFGVLVDEDYEYIDMGNFIVYKSEKQEDKETYLLTCYDKLLKSMKEYENIGVIYPINIRDYLTAICNYLQLPFANSETIFANWNKIIPNEKYLDASGNSLGYTFRDVLDELAQVTASTICINKDDEIEIRYINNTLDTITGKYLKNVNVNFGQKYGPINSIVLSRSSDTDNVYLQDSTSVQENGLCELKIVDNQIMNDNNRSDYLPDILGILGGLEYYLNDFSSTGICYYDLCDRYNIEIEDNTYSCIMLNDEINVTDGLEEIIFTDMLKESETDYEKADKTDRKINQTYILVDKQNQVIESVVTNVTEQNNKISQITQTVDELSSKIQDIADITIAGETNYANVELADINESEPIMVKIHPINENISYLYPRANGLYPSDTQYLPNRILRFKNITTNEIFDYELPDDLLYYDSEHYDEFYLSYDSNTCEIIKKCKYNADGTVSLLTNEIVNSYDYPLIELTDGDYEISLLGYEYGYLSVRLMTTNVYTSQFATKVEVKSQIQQTAESIDLSVNTKLSNYSTTTEMNSAITLKANQINSVVSQKVGKNEIISNINQTSESIRINANKINLSANNILDIISGNTLNLTTKTITIDSTNFKVTKDGVITAKSGTIGGFTIGATNLYNNKNSLTSSSNGVYIGIDGISLGSGSTFKVTNNGQVNASNLNITGGSISLNSPDYNSGIRTTDGTNWSVMYNGGIQTTGSVASGNGNAQTVIGNGTGSYQKGGSDYTIINGGTIEAISYTYHSLENIKKNIKKYNKKALNIVKNSDIYEYNYKSENDKHKKHVGFIIGEKYKTPKEILSEDEKTIDSYSTISILWKALQEQQEQIEQLKKEIKILKGEK